MGDVFTATYVFDNPATAAIAADASLGERAMAWQVVDARRQPSGSHHRRVRRSGAAPASAGRRTARCRAARRPPRTSTQLVPTSTAPRSAISGTPAVAIPGTPADHRLPGVGDRHGRSQGRRRRAHRDRSPHRQPAFFDGRHHHHGPPPARVTTTTSKWSRLAPSARRSRRRRRPLATDSIIPVTLTASPAGGSYALTQQVEAHGQ